MRKLIILLSCCTALLLLGYAGYRGYKVWRQNRWLSLAKDFAAKGDDRNTLLSLQQVLRLNPVNVEASRMMANASESVNPAGALVWRQRVLELNPSSLDDRLALTKTALRFRAFPIASNTLAGVDAAGQKTAQYHNLAGLVTLTTGQREAAALHFSEAARIEPWNSIPQLNLAVLRLGGSNSLDMAEARISLQRISLNSTNQDLRCMALRELVSDALRTRQTNAAVALSKDLLQLTNSNFGDRLLRLDVLRETGQAALKPELAAFQENVATNKVHIFLLADWQMPRIGPAETLAWLKTLSLPIQTNPPVAFSMADCRTALKDWPGLQATLQSQNWAELEHLRHALLALALREQGMAGASKAAWGEALKATEDQKAKLAKLLEFAAKAKWQSESEEILWTIVNRYPDEPSAVQALTGILFSNGRTRPLLSLFTLQAKRSPADLSIKNNLAMTALLLGAQELKPYEMTREVYQKAGTNAAFASTYAYSLHLQKKDAEALKVMQQLTPQQLEDPSIAGYYGLILQATGNSAQAKKYLQSAAKSRLLPEEQKIIEKALAAAK